jgi:hypothetical protein
MINWTAERGAGYELDDSRAPEPTYREQLYLQFVLTIPSKHVGKFIDLPRERKDYLFDLWLKKNGYT